MGYHTEFRGQFTITPSLTKAHSQYLLNFSKTRRMKRNPEALQLKYKGKYSKDGDYGQEGEFFAIESEALGQAIDATVIDYNKPAKGQPGLICQWVPTKNWKAIEWDRREKFDGYIEWIEYLIEKILKPWGYSLSGRVKWRGDLFDDIGIIIIKNNIVTIR